jgi:hypothetical protein
MTDTYTCKFVLFTTQQHCKQVVQTVCINALNSPFSRAGKAAEADTWRTELRAATERAETAEQLVRAREADVEDIRQAYEVLDTAYIRTVGFK